MSKSSRMTPFRCPNELYDRVRETMARVKPEVNGRSATLTDVIVVALSEWCDSKMQWGLERGEAPSQGAPKKTAKKKPRKKKEMAT